MPVEIRRIVAGLREPVHLGSENEPERIAARGLPLVHDGTHALLADRRSSSDRSGQPGDLERVFLRQCAVQTLKDARIAGATKYIDSVLRRAFADRNHDATVGRAAVVAQRELWPEPVEGSDLLCELLAAVRRHVVLGEHEAVAIALWILHTYCIDAAEISPRLALLSPTKRCGKTTTLKLLAALVSKPLIASNISAAALFRIVDAEHPTLLIDEADSFMEDAEGLRNILNAGHDRGAAHVVRCAGKDSDFAPVVFSAWSPVGIAHIGELRGTLADRSIAIRLRRKSGAADVEPMRRRQQNALGPLARRCARWADDHILEVQLEACDELPLASDRAADNWEPLVCIARVAGGDAWRVRAVSAAQALTSPADMDEAGTELGERLLHDVRALFDARVIGDRVSMHDLASALAEMDGAPWQEVARGKPITTSFLGRRLAAFGVKPKPIRFSDRTRKGYERAAFEDAFARDLDAEPVTLVTTRELQRKAGNGDGLQQPFVTGALGPISVSSSAHVTDVTEQSGERARYDFEERSAILEFDAGFSREDADRLARGELFDA